VTLVADASVMVATLTDERADGRWARSILTGEPLAAPHLMPAEVASVLRRAVFLGDFTQSTASSAHHELLQIPVVLYGYHELADRIWELRHNITIYDAWYIALAEALDVELATLDVRLTRAPGVRCAFLVPPAYLRRPANQQLDGRPPSTQPARPELSKDERGP
jgi:predicted nucleic acid-binding protein